jgi:hypothetical protein
MKVQFNLAWKTASKIDKRVVAGEKVLVVWGE